MLRFMPSVVGALVAVISICFNAQATTETANPLPIQQPAPNLHSLFIPHDSSSPSLDPSQRKRIDRPAGFGSLNNDSSSSFYRNIPVTSTNCPEGYNHDSRCTSPTTSTDGKSLNVLERSKSVFPIPF